MRRTESSNRVDDLIERVTADLEESGLEGGLLTEERARSVDLDVSNRTEMTISTRSDDGGGLGESHHSESGSSRSSGHAEGGEGLSLRGELDRSLESDDGGGTEEDGRTSASGGEEGVDILLVERSVDAFDGHSAGESFEGKLSLGEEGGEVGRSSRCADELDPGALGDERGERNRVVGGSCSRQGDVVGKSGRDDGCGGSGGDEEGRDEEGGEHAEEKGEWTEEGREEKNAAFIRIASVLVLLCPREIDERDDNELESAFCLAS